MKYTLIIISLILFSCEEKSTSLESMRAEIMKIHDNSMLKMGEIRKTTFELEEMASSSPDSLVIKAIIRSLESADEGMMLWMQEYKEPEIESELKSFYEEEKQKIKIVADNIYKSLENAQKYIKE